MKFKHSCGHVFNTRPLSVLGQDSCVKCAGKLQMTHAEYRKKLKATRPEFEPVEKYVQSRTKSLHRHVPCGYEWRVAPNTLLAINTGCPSCAVKAKNVTTQGGKQFSLRGYEPQALKVLLRQGYKPSEITDDLKGKTPRIRYRYGAKQRIYRPDFYIARRNMIVEVKSLATLGVRDFRFGCSVEALRKTQAKARQCIRDGFNFRLMVMRDNGTQIRVPSDWMHLSRSQLQDAVSI